MRRRLSIVERMADSNLVWFVRLNNSPDIDGLRQALDSLQRRHPALRALLREEPDGLYYESDSAPKIPLRAVRRSSEDDYCGERQAELTTAIPHDQPLLRVVWLQSESECDLLLTASHRICDAMSMFTLVREVVHSLNGGEELSPQMPITTNDLIGSFRPSRPWINTAVSLLINGLLRLIPRSRALAENIERHSEWKASRELSDALKYRCKAEKVSIHAAFTVALERALFTIYGKKMFPRWIMSPMDLRRGRFAALKDDAVFSGAGNFKLTTQPPDDEFWTRVRSIDEEVQRKIQQEVQNIPKRLYFLEKLRPLADGQINSLIKLLDWFMQRGDRLNQNGDWNGFGLSNLGNIAVDHTGEFFQVKDLHLYTHSFNFRMLGLIPYSINGDMRFYYVSDERWLGRCPADALEREFMALLTRAAVMRDDDICVGTDALTLALQ
jgi:hypothetical protein